MSRPKCNAALRVAGAALLLALVAACHTATAVEGERPDPLTPPGIEVHATGGVAPLDIVARVDSATGRSMWRVAPLCEAPALCPATDSVEGTLARGVIDGFFARAAANDFRRLHADYGTTPQGADMRTYTLTIHAAGRARTLRGDDGTMPALLAQYVGDVLNAARVAAAR